MELEDVSEDVKWEARRIAAAFDLRRWRLSASRSRHDFEGMESEPFVSWSIFCAPYVFIEWIRIGRQAESDLCLAVQEDSGWRFALNPLRQSIPTHTTLMARGLYRLGIEYDAVPSQLPPLSAHEKLELRLSLPREFWPKKWLDEDGE